MKRARGDATALLLAQEGTPLTPRAPAKKRARRALRSAPPRAVAIAQKLDGSERLRIIDVLLTVIEGAYCHLVQKRAAYAIDPPQALRLLRTRAVELSDGEFHLAITSIVSGLRDAHTRYSGPRALQGAVARLPFLVEQYGPHDRPSFMVSKISDRRLIDDKRFVQGVELETWNGIAFARAVELYADQETGGRPDARRARALESLTFRALQYGPPPDEQWVVVGYRDIKTRTLREVRIPWRIVRPGGETEDSRLGARAARFRAANPSAELVRRAKKLMFSGAIWEAEQRGEAVARRTGWLASELPDVLAARDVSSIAGAPMGYLRVWSFDVDDDERFIAEVLRLISQLPQAGLILDLRGNPGGLIWAAERMLQLFTPYPITPTRFSLLATPLTRAMAASPFNRLELEAWLPSLDSAILTGEPYSRPLPLTEPDWCNDLGQHYSGPVVCVVDPNTYSSGDLFAAGFVDNGIGPLVCVGEATGAGGANVWTDIDMRQALADTPYALDALPQGVSYSIAIRRALRSASADGVPIEDLGVAGQTYAMSRDDLVNDNRDLIRFCAGLLQGGERTEMRVELHADRVDVHTQGLSELETYVEGRPFEAVRRIHDGTHRFPRPIAQSMRFVGRRRGEVKQHRLVNLEN